MSGATDKSRPVAKQPTEPGTGVGAGPGTGAAGGWIAAGLSAVVLLSVGVFWPTLDHAFLNWDDDRNFVSNPDYRGLSGEHLRWAWQTYHVGVWQPLAWMLLGLEHTLGGVDENGAPAPRVYHAFSIGLHALNAAMVFAVALLILRRAMPRLWHESQGNAVFGAWVAAAFFAVHPLRVEAVAWISCQPYLPAVFFYLLAVAIHVSLHGGAEGRSSAVLAAGWLATLACYAAAVGFKAVAISLPLVLLILDAYPLRRIGGRAGWRTGSAMIAALEKLPFLALAALVAVRAARAKDFSESRLPLDAVDYGRAAAQAAWGLVHYLWKTLAPLDLIAYVRLPDDLGLATPRFALAAASVVVVSLSTLVLARRIPALTAAWWAYVAILLPNLGLVQISQQLATDRYAYLASVPLMALLAGGLARYWRWRATAAARARAALVALAGLVMLVWLTLPQSRIWRDSVALWRANVAVDPGGAVGHCQLGHACAMEGQAAPARRHFEKAVALRDDFAFAHANLGGILISQGEFDAAIMALNRAIQSPHGLPAGELMTVHANLAIAHAAVGNAPLARQHLTQAQRLGCPPEQTLRIMEFILAE